MFESLNAVGTVLSSTPGVYYAFLNSKKEKTITVMLDSKSFSNWEFERMGLHGFDIDFISISASSGVTIGNWVRNDIINDSSYNGLELDYVCHWC